MATATQERDEILHRLSNLIQVIGANMLPLERELRTAEGRAIVDDIKIAATEATLLFRRLLAVL